MLAKQYVYIRLLIFVGMSQADALSIVVHCFCLQSICIHLPCSWWSRDFEVLDCNLLYIHHYVMRMPTNCNMGSSDSSTMFDVLFSQPLKGTNSHWPISHHWCQEDFLTDGISMVPLGELRVVRSTQIASLNHRWQHENRKRLFECYRL